MNRNSCLRHSMPLILGVVVAAPAECGEALEEIIVSAQRREEAIQDVGIAITAMSGDDLANIGATTTTQITEQVPGLRLVTFSPSMTIFSLRGVSQNNFQDNLEAPVAVYMDDAYIASMNAVGTQMFDMDRVEVLRGPQGTLFGRNTTGGLIHFVSRHADDATPNGYLEVSASDFNDHSVEGAVGGGLGERVRGRLAGRWEKADGYVESVTPGVRDAHGANGYALRGALQADFTDDFKADLIVRYSKDTDVPSGAYTVRFATFDPDTGFGIPLGEQLTGNLEHASLIQGGFDRETISGTARLSWRLGGNMELVSLTNYLTLDKDYLEDGAGGLPIDDAGTKAYFPYHTVADFDEFSQEFRLSGSTERSRWQVGAYYLDMTWDLAQTVAGGLILSNSTGSFSDTQSLDTLSLIDARNWSAFGQAEFDLTSRLTLIAGLRWSQDNKDLLMSRVYQDIPEGIPPQETIIIPDPGFPGLSKIDYGDYAARLQLNYKPDEETLLYASLSRGIKGGNWSLDPLGAVATDQLKHGEETLNAAEIGWKTLLLDGSMRLSTAAFYYDYRDYQTFSLLNLTPQVANSDARAYGGELEVAWVPAEGWEFNLGTSVLHSRVDAVPDVFGGTVEAELPSAPHLSLNFLGRYQWPVPGGTMGAQLDGVYNGDQYLEGTNSGASLEKSYTVLNARLDFTTAGNHWNFALWCRNLGDTEYRLYSLDLGLIGFLEMVYAPPRWLGATVSYRWQ